MATFIRSILVLIASLSAIVARADEPRISNPHFMGAQSCQSSMCHGGGTDKGQNIMWLKHDKHSHAHAILANNQSKQIAAGAGISDPTRSARCTVCHSPLEALSGARFGKNAKVDRGVSCESCHGPASNWFLFHTRKDTNHEQRIALGMRETRDLYHRANMCIACHHMIDPDLAKAGHPAMYFELDGQTDTMLDIKLDAITGRPATTVTPSGKVENQKPHWIDEGTWLGPRAWLTGQAAALRETSWKAGKGNDPDLIARTKALVWLLRKTESGANLPQGDDFAAIQSAADRLARTASKQQWSKDSTLRALKMYAALTPEFREGGTARADQRRRGEVLVYAVDRLWVALRTHGNMKSDNLDKAIIALAGEARKQSAFDPARFAGALQTIEAEIELIPKT